MILDYYVTNVNAAGRLEDTKRAVQNYYMKRQKSMCGQSMSF